MLTSLNLSFNQVKSASLFHQDLLHLLFATALQMGWQQPPCLQLTGSLPPGWVSASASLQTLDLSYNNISASLPSDWVYLPEIKHLAVDSNFLTVYAAGRQSLQTALVWRLQLRLMQ